MRLRGSALTASLLLAAACSSSSSSPQGGAPSAPAGVSTAEVQAVSRLTAIIPTPIIVDGASGWTIVDTGNPWTVLDGSTFPSAAKLPAAGGTLSTIQIGSQIVTDVFAVAGPNADENVDALFSIRANAGCSAVCGQVVSFDYRAVTIALGEPHPPSDTAASIALPFSFEGGGTYQGIPVPTSRLVVTVTLEGADYSMIVDTGASFIVVSDAAFSALTKDGRAELTSEASTIEGVSSISLARAASATVGGVSVNDLIVAHDTSFDQNLAELSSDVGHTIDGSLGGSFLDQFYVTVDYPNQRVVLSRYPSMDFAIDPGRSLDITLATDGMGKFEVASTEGDAATIGLQPGDEVVAIDGQELASISAPEGIALLYGSVGTTKQVRLGNAGALSDQTVTLTVEEHLPLLTGSGP